MTELQRAAERALDAGVFLRVRHGGRDLVLGTRAALTRTRLMAAGIGLAGSYGSTLVLLYALGFEVAASCMLAVVLVLALVCARPRRAARILAERERRQQARDGNAARGDGGGGDDGGSGVDAAAGSPPSWASVRRDQRAVEDGCRRLTAR